MGKKGRLPAFFANLVPESEIRELLERSFGVETGNDIALLAAVGDDLPGAVPIALTMTASEETSLIFQRKRIRRKTIPRG